MCQLPTDIDSIEDIRADLEEIKERVASVVEDLHKASRGGQSLEDRHKILEALDSARKALKSIQVADDELAYAWDELGS